MKTLLIVLLAALGFLSMQVDKKPRVLIIGDSVSMGYTPFVKEFLADIADVSRPAANCGSTRIGLRDIDKWVGDTAWAVIHFNFGLHDLGYRFANDQNQNEKGEYATPFNGGHINVPVKEYSKNLSELIKRLRKTGAKLIFATTTPVNADLHSYVKDSELPFNEVALKVMRKEKVRINDLWGFSKPRIDSLQIPGNPHFTSKGSRALAKEVAKNIREVLQ